MYPRTDDFIVTICVRWKGLRESVKASVTFDVGVADRAARDRLRSMREVL